MNTKKTNQGFTVLNLTILIAVIAILTAIFYPSYLRANKAIIGSKIVSDMNNIKIGATKYYIKYGDYPDSYRPSLDDEPLTANQKKFIELIDGKKWPMPPLGEFIIEKTPNHTIIKGKSTRHSYYKYNYNGVLSKVHNGVSIVNLKGIDGKELNLSLVTLLQE